MNDRELDLTASQKEIKAKYPAINKKYECESVARAFRVVCSYLSHSPLISCRYSPLRLTTCYTNVYLI